MHPITIVHNNPLMLAFPGFLNQAIGRSSTYLPIGSLLENASKLPRGHQLVVTNGKLHIYRLKKFAHSKQHIFCSFLLQLLIILDLTKILFSLINFSLLQIFYVVFACACREIVSFGSIFKKEDIVQIFFLIHKLFFITGGKT